MVSLAAIEALAAELWPKAMSAAATEIDPRKGERIVLVTQQKERPAPISWLTPSRRAPPI